MLSRVIKSSHQRRKAINVKRIFIVLVMLALATVLFAGTAMANGTITATFIYNGSGVNQPLAGAYVYLHAYPLGAPIMEKYFRKAQYILGPSDANGNISVSVPDGAYRIMLIRRAPLSATPTQAQSYGPPRDGDYTWHLAGNSPSVTVTTDSAINLGTVYASIFSGPITISGRVMGASGKALAGWFVKATIVPCTGASQCPSCSNQCGSVRYPALFPTDSNGNYIVKLKNTGTYYVYACRGFGNSCGNSGYGGAPGGYSTCSTFVGNAGLGGYRYWNCPIAVNGNVSNVNVSVPGY